jgi:ubiquinone/menaquinone biosynthesis C-methylase UbiE
MLEICSWIFVILVGVGLFSIATPVLLITSPFWVSGLVIIYIILKLFGIPVWKYVISVYNWLLFKSDKPRKYAWKTFYNILCWMFPQDEWRTMNYGYAINTEKGHSILLAVDEESERFSYQLYHYIATGFKKNANLQGQNILEVGSGRGGGLNYIVKNLKPLTAKGVDYSHQQIDFCKKNYTGSNITFVWGDAENIPAEDDSIDLVINVESSHCYGNFDKFVSEVARILKPQGHFMVTDFISYNSVEEYENTLKKHLDLVESKDITQNVLLSLKFDSKRRAELIKSRTPWFLRGILTRFSGCEGSNIYQELESRSSIYMAYKLTKKQS